VTFYGDHIEAHRMVRVSAVSRHECSGRANEFLLFVMVNGVTRRRKGGRSPETYFDERQTIAIKHDEIDFTASAAIVSAHGSEPLAE